MSDFIGWAGLIAVGIMIGMILQALRDSVRPDAGTEDAPADNGYVPAVEEEEFRNFG